MEKTPEFLLGFLLFKEDGEKLPESRLASDAACTGVWLAFHFPCVPPELWDISVVRNPLVHPLTSSLSKWPHWSGLDQVNTRSLMLHLDRPCKWQKTKHWNPYLQLFPRSLAGKWIGSAAAGTWTSAHVDGWHCRQVALPTVLLLHAQRGTGWAFSIGS